jgi:hypothetical protein
MHDGQKNQPDLHRPSGKYLASVAISCSMYVSVNLNEKVLRGDHICESQGSDMEPQLGIGGSTSEETSAVSGAEEYVVPSPTALETRRLRPTRHEHACDAC